MRYCTAVKQCDSVELLALNLSAEQIEVRAEIERERGQQELELMLRNRLS